MPRLQHALHAVKMTGWIYMVLAESEWNSRRYLDLNPAVSGIYLSHTTLDNGFDEHGQHRSALVARISGELPALDALLNRSGWRRTKAAGEDLLLHICWRRASVMREVIHARFACSS